MYESGFLSLAELVSRKMWWAVKNVIRRRVAKKEEFLEDFGGKTAVEWAEHYRNASLATELRYYVPILRPSFPSIVSLGKTFLKQYL
jgi:hypothetical protein